MANTMVSKTIVRKDLWVRLPPPVLEIGRFSFQSLLFSPLHSTIARMRTDEEYRQILTLWEQGTNQLQIARHTGIQRATVRDCIKKFHSLAGLQSWRKTKPKEPWSLIYLRSSSSLESYITATYAYLLGLYLGDGYINKEPRTFRLRISLDTQYPHIIAACNQAIQDLLPLNRVYMVKKPYNCIEVGCYNNYWPIFFPQHGKGMKHTRAILLEEWQQRAIQYAPLAFFRGCIHSDGARTHNIVKGHDYPRYEFCNHSTDIKRIFCDTCDLLGVHWIRSSNGKIIQIARRADVAFLDQHIGPKS
jgi:hypothetical protein